MLLLVIVALLAGDLPSPSDGAAARVRRHSAPSRSAAYGGFYKALELGPIAIVSPIASANGAMIVLLAVIVLGESLTRGQALGCALVLGFIVLASLEPAAERLSGDERHSARAGRLGGLRPATCSCSPRSPTTSAGSCPS